MFYLFLYFSNPRWYAKQFEILVCNFHLEFHFSSPLKGKGGIKAEIRKYVFFPLVLVFTFTAFQCFTFKWLDLLLLQRTQSIKK